MNIRDERGIIVNWLVKLLIALAVVGVMLFDAGSIAANFFGLDSTANDVAIQLSEEVSRSAGGGCFKTPALDASAKALAKEHEARPVEVTVEQEPACIVRVTLRRRADTLIVGRIGPIKDWAVATADGQSGSE